MTLTKADRDALIHSVSLLKRNAMAAPFEHAFTQQAALEAQHDPANPAPAGTLVTVSYRADEAFYLVPAHDRVTVVFSTRFEEETDRIFGKVFLQEFVDARRQPSIQNAPQVLYSSREPPLEIRDVPGLQRGEDTGYVTFVLFPRHFQHPEKRFSTISHIQLFRDYLHYHSTLFFSPSQMFQGVYAQPHAFPCNRVPQGAEPRKARTRREAAQNGQWAVVPAGLGSRHPAELCPYISTFVLTADSAAAR